MPKIHIDILDRYMTLDSFDDLKHDDDQWASLSKLDKEELLQKWLWDSLYVRWHEIDPTPF